ncbi:MAG: phosphatase PAP2 family protein [Paludibacter sp.]|nr:phosphatase PAP2 family protein [Paludibacter sp.]
MDEIMYFVSKVWIWAPLYLTFIIYAVKRWKLESIWIIAAVIICVVATDQLTNLTKEVFQRLRPSHEPLLEGLVHHVNGYVGGRFGFVSGHSSNAFGFAMLSSLIIRNPSYSIFVFFWSGLVAYSRMYLGVHYPLDIVGGVILGLIVAAGVFLILEKVRKRLRSAIKSGFDD